MTSAPRLEIHSAHDIVAALGSPDMAVRLAMCQAAAARPAHVLAYAAAAGVDLVAAFLAAADQRTSLVYRKACLGAVVHFDDVRVVRLFKEILLSSNESDMLRLAAKRVALDDTPDSRIFLRERLLSENSPLRVRCIASALAGSGDFSCAEILRLVIAGGGGARAVEQWPRDHERSAACWANELQGPFALHARRLLEVAGNRDDLLALLPTWLAWSEHDRTWLFRWGKELFGTMAPSAVCALLATALTQSAKSVQLAALAWCAQCPNAVPAEALQRHAASPDPEIRAAALSAMPLQVFDWWQLAQADPEPTVRAIAVERALAQFGIVGAAAELAELILDPDWRVRAAVVRGLNQAGPAALDTARGWLGHASPAVRAGALQILLEQGQEGWLMNDLMG